MSPTLKNIISGILPQKTSKATKAKTKKIKEPRVDAKAQRKFEKGQPSLIDFLSPSAIEIEPTHIKISDRFAKSFFATTFPRYLNTAWLSSIINLDRTFDLSLFFSPLEPDIILKNLRKKAARVGAQIHEEEVKGIVRDPALETAYQDIEDLRDKLTQGTERFFQFGLYLTVYTDDDKELQKSSDEISVLFESALVYLKPALFLQEQAFNSTLPLGKDELEIFTNMNTSPLSTSFPFVSFDLTANKGILYGINRHNSSLVLFDRFDLENANMVVFGKSGAGKSYAIKLEILRSLMFDTDVIIIDPENEYQYLAQTVGGEFLKISLTSHHHINPFDIPEPAKGEDPGSVLQSHMADLIGFFKVILKQVTPEEEALLERAVRETYASRGITPQSSFSKITPPRMEDFQNVIEGLEGGEQIAVRLEKYTRGIYSQFLNNYTNVELKKPLVVFNIRDLEEELRPLAMYMILNYIWRIVRRNIKKRLLVIDEAWLLMQTEAGGGFVYGIAKRARKYYLGLTTITQDVEDFLSSSYGKPVLTNSSLQMLLRQSPATIEEVKNIFNLTDEEKFLLLEADVGEGLFFAGLKHIAIRIVASYSEDQIITSDPKQLQEIERAKKELAK